MFLISIGILALAGSGCAIHYADNRSGAEHLWGFGQLRVQKEATGGGLTAVTTGYRVPGLCLELGRDHFGFTFGYLDRQRLCVVRSNEVADLRFPTAWPAVCAGGETNALWAFGHLRSRSVPLNSRHVAIVTGKALAGFGAGVGGDDTSLGLVLDGRQCAVVLDPNAQLDFDQDAPRWPGFDLFSMRISSSIQHDSNQTLTLRKP